jgi:hypothetical protein
MDKVQNNIGGTGGHFKKKKHVAIIRVFYTDTAACCITGETLD